jgi:hypothetical protein
MATLKLLSAALLAATVVASPAMARHHHVTRHSTDSAYVVAQPDAAYGYGAYGYRCVPAPRVGAFASQPWDNNVPCEPWSGPAY